MDKLDKLKLASSSFGERLITGGANVSRLVGTKVKEILQAPTPESKIVDEATLETMEEPNWGLNLRICAMINGEELNGTEVVKAIKKKIGLGKNVVGQRLSLDLLETCTSNCDKVFSEVASEKVLEDMVAMVKDDRTDGRNRRKAVEMIRSWGESEELMYLPVFRQTHLVGSGRNRACPVAISGMGMPGCYFRECPIAAAVMGMFGVAAAVMGMPGACPDAIGGRGICLVAVGGRGGCFCWHGYVELLVWGVGDMVCPCQVKFLSMSRQEELIETLAFLIIKYAFTLQSLKTDRIPTGSRGGNSGPLYETMDSLVYQQPLSPRPLPDMDLMGLEDDIPPYSYGGQSAEQKKELLVVSRNSLDLLSSILDSGVEPIPINDELTVSMLEKCKESLPLIQRIAETTTDDDILLFEALNLHDELEQVISRCKEIKATVGSEPLKIDDVKSTDTVRLSENGTAVEIKSGNTEGSRSVGEVEVKEGSESVGDQKDENLGQKQSV
ncbi:hypothetical protein OSB04_000929 [Centaurea solstitialis]|uniref:VHS domain-containing protein n=1 Tax=Centaurea solstitialis TaxID=347529 RepID=A0AA38TXJ7_9ASTR|nr:hypothetical protein OSB04_000929 [Centaurea solstitialis]